MAGSMSTTKRYKRKVESIPSQSIADAYRERLGRKPSTTPFHTTANRECGTCRVIKPGSEFDVPITPGRPDLNSCRACQPKET